MMIDRRRRQTHSAAVSVRINPLFLGRVEQAAIDRGMSIAEFTRYALRSELERVAA